MSARRNGKIATCPPAIREAVNLRLLEGETYQGIADWLNAQEPVLRVLDERWNEQPITFQNVGEWKAGGYRDWTRQRRRAEELKGLSAYARRLAENGQGLSGGAAAIAAGKVMELLEMVADADLASMADAEAENDPVAALSNLVLSVTRLQKGDHDSAKLALAKRVAAQKDRALALAEDKFQTQTAEKFLVWAKSPEAQGILDSGKPRGAQIGELRRLMFGEVGQ